MLKVFEKNTYYKLFFLFFIIYIFCASFLTMNHDMGLCIDNNVVYGTDAYFKTIQLTLDYHNFLNFRSIIHPLPLIILKPFTTTLCYNRLFCILVLQAVSASLSVCLLFYLMNKIFNDYKKTLILSFFFGFNYALIIFVSVVEYYTFSLFLMLALIAFTLNLQEKINKKDIFVISFLCILLFGIDTYNIFLALIILFFLRKDIFNYKLLLVSFMIIQFIILNYLQVRYYSVSVFANDYLTPKSILNYELQISEISKALLSFIDGLKNVYFQIFCNGFIAFKIIKDVEALPTIRINGSPTLYSLIPMTLLYFYPIFSQFKQLKTLFISNKLFKLSVLIILFQIVCYTFYSNSDCFLYSLKIFPFVFIIFAYLMKKFPLKNLIIIFLPLTILEIYINITSLINIEAYIAYFFNETFRNPEIPYLLKNTFIIIIILMFLIKNKTTGKIFKSSFNLSVIFYISISILLVLSTYRT